ncbi:MAG: DUF6457 domain-containing protein [Acidimicrobiales bacterium]|jgi:hypothetical protein
MTLTARDWIEQFAGKLGIAAPTEKEQSELLELAGVAAHASERTAAPITCWLAARAGVGPGEAGRIGRELAEQLGAKG